MLSVDEAATPHWTTYADLVLKFVSASVAFGALFWAVKQGLAQWSQTLTQWNESLKQWRENQRWRKAERLDRLIREFEERATLRFAAKVLDWVALRTTHPNDAVIQFTSANVRKALTIHEPGKSLQFHDVEVLIREALDDLLSFFVRVRSEIEGELVDRNLALDHFAYWIFRANTMLIHREDTDADGRVIAESMRKYEGAYSDPAALNALYEMAKTRPIYRALTQTFNAGKK